jgi:hypothetical protein
MPRKPRGASRQPELFERSKRPTIPIDPSHRLVLLKTEQHARVQGRAAA